MVMLHELGHFLMAKRAGIGVEEFGFGLPPRIWGKKIRGTIYSINWLPFGGFVRLVGEDPDDKQSFSSNKQSFSSNKNLSFAQNLDSRSARIKQSLWPSPSKNSTAGLESLRGLKNIYGRGVINAVKTGFKKFTGEAVVVMPADLADDPETINRMFKKFLQGYDIVCATRYAKGGRKIGGGFLKTALSRTAGIMTPLLLGIQTTDIANGFKMYRRKVIESMKIESTGGWEYSTEMVIKAHRAGFKIGEVPTIWRDRTSGKSKFKLLKWLPKYIRWYLWGILLRLNVNRLVV